MASILHTFRRRLLFLPVLLFSLILLFLFSNFHFPSSLNASNSLYHQVVRQRITLSLMTPPPSNLTPPPDNNYYYDNTTNCTCKRTKKFPTALIIGVRKGGTRALINMLSTHPRVVSAVREVHYFDRSENFKKGVQWYIDQMPYSTTDQITIEKSPSYFVTPAAAQRVANLSPGVKIILIVRNPIDRAVSDFTQLHLLQHHRKKIGGDATFEDEIFTHGGGSLVEINTKSLPISVSLYDVHFKRWLERFSLEQMLIVDGDMLIRDPAKELRKAEEFLGIENYFTSEMFYFNATKGFHCWRKMDKRGNRTPYCLGSSKGRRHPHIANSTYQILSNFFRPHNEKFFAQIKQRFQWNS